jgi:hypothetical protein
VTVRWLSYDAPVDGPQIVASLAHALRQNARYRDKITDGGRRALDRAILARYELCVDLGLGADADTLVFEHRFEVAR